MKHIFTVFLIFWLAGKGFGQTPANDKCWPTTPGWGDEFNGSSVDGSKWDQGLGWEDFTHPYYIRTDGNNTPVQNGYVSLQIKKENYPGQIGWDYDRFGHATPKTKNFPFTTGGITTGNEHKFLYGYLEANIRFPTDFHQDVYGDYFDMAYWLFGGSAKTDLDIDWSELDFEIVSAKCDMCNAMAPNILETNVHMMKPSGTGAFRAAVGLPTHYEGNPEHFMARKIDNSNPTYWDSFFRYKNFYHRHLIPGGEFHKFGYEWAPDQIKFYLDDKLWFRLEGDYVYNYEHFGGFIGRTGPPNYNPGYAVFNPTSIRPIHELKAPMPILLGVDFKPPDPSNNNTAGSLSMDVDYVRYYTLKMDCNTDFIQPAYDFCAQYGYNESKVYHLAQFGQAGHTGPPIAEVKSCRVTVRANDILLLDGFKVDNEGEFYAQDLSCY
jgi:beta-glucanase (GH16 family)